MTRYPELGEAFERLHAASLELTRLHDVSEIAETALSWALTLTGSTLGFIKLTGETDAADLTFSLSVDGRRFLPRQEIDSLLHAGAGDSSLVHALNASGRELGVAGVSREADYSEVERHSFAIFANQVGAAISGASADPSDAKGRLRTQLEKKTDELGRLVKRLEAVDAARQLLLKNVVSAQDQAARRIAAKLHDDALQTLTAAELHLHRVELSRPEGAPALAEAKALLLQTEEALRHLLFEVRPPALENPGGLEATIRERLMMLKALTDAELTVDLHLPDELAYEVKSMVFRQVAEALSNVEKHSRATRVEVSVRLVDGNVHGVVVDNGQGFIVAERNNMPGHLGLLSLRERAILAGGWYRIESEPGAGTRIEFGVPVS
ncbi:MAG TPA: ATP-binding protein [Candidatus Dormibacteraeota bacterium]|nr:ATP-binding protein [Candidatus Dormibacteraeota bacterium]